jgi:hypothetical protein
MNFESYIRWFYDNWAGTNFGILFNIVIFAVGLTLPAGPALYFIWFWGFSVLGVWYYGWYRGWNDRS